MNEMHRAERPLDTPMPSAAEIQRLIAAELSLPSRLGYTGLLLTSLTGAGVVGALLVTEPGLPVRTQAAFAVLVMMALSWGGFAGWVLTRRRILLAAHRVVAARMAVAFTAVFTAGAWALGQWGGTGRTWYGAVAVGVVLLAVAVVMLVSARRRFGDLSRRRLALERQLGGAGGTVR
jgi:hypothetical protein